LPVDFNGTPDWDFMDRYMKEKEQKIIACYQKYADKKLSISGGGVNIIPIIGKSLSYLIFLVLRLQVVVLIEENYLMKAICYTIRH
jgi:hypothetical protein